jgi:hypothetical protein
MEFELDSLICFRFADGAIPFFSLRDRCNPSANHHHFLQGNKPDFHYAMPPVQVRPTASMGSALGCREQHPVVRGVGGESAESIPGATHSQRCIRSQNGRDSRQRWTRHLHHRHSGQVAAGFFLYSVEQLANRNVGGFGWETSSRGRFATPADFPLQDRSPHQGLHERRESLGFVHRARTSFCRLVPKP